MSDEKYSGEIHAWIEPEIEARVVAMILGEASDFEAEELERLMEERPEIQAFRRRLEAMHGLLGTALAPSDDEEWQLAPERRAALLAAIAQGEPREKMPLVEGEEVKRARERRIRKAGRRVIWAAAACFGLTLFLVVLLEQPRTVLETAPGKERAGEASPETLAVSGAPMEVQESVALKEGFSLQGSAAPADGKTDMLRMPLASRKKEQTLEDSREEHDILEADLGADDVALADPVAPREEPGASGRKARAIADSVPPPPAVATPSTLSERPRNLPSTVQPAQDAEPLPQSTATTTQGLRVDDAPQLPSEKESEGRKREVAFLGLGVLLGLGLGLGLGRTWQRRAHSSH